MTEIEIDTAVSGLCVRRSDAYLETSVQDFNSYVTRLFPVEAWISLLVYYESGRLTQSGYPISSLDMADQMAGLVAFENVLNMLKERGVRVKAVVDVVLPEAR
jgi:hypothetical protein